jgi:hypothetical protein
VDGYTQAQLGRREAAMAGVAMLIAAAPVGQVRKLVHLSTAPLNALHCSEHDNPNCL